MDVPTQWEIWVGVINQEAELSIHCNACTDETDCNMNGVCTASATKDENICDCSETVSLHADRCYLSTKCDLITLSSIASVLWITLRAGGTMPKINSW